MTTASLPLVSIIVPTFNRINLLKRLLESISGQTYQNLEVVIVNNGSSDGTREYLDEICSQNERVMVSHLKSNSGSPMACYNEGVRRATGEYLGIIYDDDTLNNDAIEFLVDMATKHNSLWVVANCVDTTTGKYSFRGVTGDCAITFEDMITERYQGESWALFNKKLIEGLRFDVNMYGGESSVWLKMYKRSHALYFHRSVRTYYTQHGDNICGIRNMINNIEKVVYTDMRYLDEFRADFEKYGMLKSRHYRLGLLLALQGDKAASISHLRHYISLAYLLKSLIHISVLALPTWLFRQLVVFRSRVLRKG